MILISCKYTFRFVPGTCVLSLHGGNTLRRLRCWTWRSGLADHLGGQSTIDQSADSCCVSWWWVCRVRVQTAMVDWVQNMSLLRNDRLFTARLFSVKPFFNLERCYNCTVNVQSLPVSWIAEIFLYIIEFWGGGVVLCGYVDYLPSRGPLLYGNKHHYNNRWMKENLQAPSFLGKRTDEYLVTGLW